jgi:hypothetical protein
MSKIDKHFVSEIDKKIAEFNATHAKSPAQKAEYDKYQRISQQRDIKEESQTSENDIWS